MKKNAESALQAEALAFLGSSPYVYLATCDHGQPHVRPMALFCVEDEYWMVTFSGDAKVHQITNNAAIEICYPIREEGNTGYVRATGTSKIVKDRALREAAMEFCYFFDDYFSGVDDPDYTLIQLELTELELMRPGETFSQRCTLKR